MRTIKKAFITAVALCLSIMVFAACTTSFAYTFEIDTGNTVKVKLNTTGGHELKENDGAFTVEKDGNVLVQGSFWLKEYCEQAFEVAGDTAEINLIEDKSTETIPYIIFEDESTSSYCYLVLLNSTGIGLETTESVEVLRECVALLSFEAKTTV